MIPIEDTQTGADPGIEDATAPKVVASRKTRQRERKRKRNIGIAVGVLLLILAGVALWWFVIRDDDPSGTTAESSVSGDQPQSDDGVEIIQQPSLSASATIDGEPTDQPVDITFGSETELVVTVLNDGNLTMDDITVALELSDADGPIDEESDECDVPALAPDESGDCTLLFTPTDEMTGAAARVLGLGPQEQEVDLSVTISFG